MVFRYNMGDRKESVEGGRGSWREEAHPVTTTVSDWLIVSEQYNY